jgi:hypothetical protein
VALARERKCHPCVDLCSTRRRADRVAICPRRPQQARLRLPGDHEISREISGLGFIWHLRGHEVREGRRDRGASSSPARPRRGVGAGLRRARDRQGAALQPLGATRRRQWQPHGSAHFRVGLCTGHGRERALRQPARPIVSVPSIRPGSQIAHLQSPDRPFARRSSRSRPTAGAPSCTRAQSCGSGPAPRSIHADRAPQPTHRSLTGRSADASWHNRRSGSRLRRWSGTARSQGGSAACVHA